MPALIAELAGSCLTLMATGDHRRLKVCGNDACSWMFVDESANRTRRWCDSMICGNLVKVRRFRRLWRQSKA
jgi:predicted RNA-binding Zn ribbon-like protein